MLLNILVKLLARRNNIARGTRRRRKNGHVTLDCPCCHTLGVAAQFTEEEFTGDNLGWPWQVVRDLFECSACKKLMNAEAFKNDGAGVMKVRTWDCPSCKADNSALNATCKTCGFTLR